MIYTTEYWGQLPGTAPAKAWFEKLHENTPVIRKLKELFATQKSGAQLNKADKNNVSEKVVALPGKQEDKVNVSKQFRRLQQNPLQNRQKKLSLKQIVQ